LGIPLFATTENYLGGTFTDNVKVEYSAMLTNFIMLAKNLQRDCNPQLIFTGLTKIKIVKLKKVFRRISNSSDGITITICAVSSVL
jgi:hypothetical protein